MVGAGVGALSSGVSWCAVRAASPPAAGAAPPLLEAGLGLGGVDLGVRISGP